MTKKEFSYVVISTSGEKFEEIHGVYKDVEGACYGARSALTTLFPKHGDEAKIILYPHNKYHDKKQIN
jgi:hypothetical protein